MTSTPLRDWREVLEESKARANAGEIREGFDLFRQADALRDAAKLNARAAGPSAAGPLGDFDLAVAIDAFQQLRTGADEDDAFAALAKQVEEAAEALGPAVSARDTWQSFGELGRLYGSKPPPVPWLIEGTFARNTAVMLAADGAVGKTWLALDLALAVAEDGRGPMTILGKPLAPDASGPAVVLTAEDDTGEIHRRLHTLDPTGERRRRAEGRLFVLPMPDLEGTARPVPLAIEDRQLPERFKLGEGFEGLRDWLRTIKPALVVFDPLAALSWLDANDNSAGGFLMGTLNHLAAELKACVVMTHHLRKAASGGNSRRDRVRGASALVNESRAVFVLQEAAPDLAADFLRRKGGRSRLEELYDTRPNGLRLDGPWKHAAGNRGAVLMGELCKSNALADQWPPRFFARGEDCRLYDVGREFGEFISLRRAGGDDKGMQDFLALAFENRNPPDDFGGPVKAEPPARRARARDARDGFGTAPKGSKPKGNGASGVGEQDIG